MTESTKKIVLLGDSILDNFYWLGNKERDLTFILNEMLNEEGYVCLNFAVDESRLRDVTNGIKPRGTYSEARTYPYPVDENGFVVPLKLTGEVSPELTVLSVGGNDFRVNIPRLIFGVDNFVSSVLSPVYRKEYEELIVKLKTISKHVILVSFFTPYIGAGSVYSLLAGYRDSIRKPWNEFIHSIAKKHHVTLIDLDKLFDPYDRSHYGTTEIEPSDKTNEMMAKVIKSIVKQKTGSKFEQ